VLTLRVKFIVPRPPKVGRVRDVERLRGDAQAISEGDALVVRWPWWRWVTSRIGGLGRAGSRDELVVLRRRRLGMTAALAVVLLGLGVFTLWGSLQTTRATQAQGRALELDAIFSDARNAVAVQEMHTRQYQLEPSVAGRTRYAESATAADDALRRAVEMSSGASLSDASRLRDEQAAYREQSDRLIALVTDRDPNAVIHDLVQVTPAYYTLQHDIDGVSRAYHSEAQRMVADLRDMQTRILATTALGFVLGLALVAMIWRVMLGYQRRIINHAEASEHQALHDSLTGLANRLLFERRLEAALAMSNPTMGQSPAVMLIDLNGFKGVNDTLGHQAGDEVLIETGHRLRKVCRAGDTVARLGGDEFAVLLPASGSVDVVKEVADRVCDVLRSNYVLPVGAAAVSGSVGIVMGTPGLTAEDLLRHADAAMYRAKTTTRAVAIYDPAVDADQPHRMALFSDLRGLLDHNDPEGQLVLFYQPQVRLADATVTAAEALVRWHHSRLGLLHPESFLAVAETGGLEIPLTYHLLRMAVAEAARWKAESRPLVVSVNVSPTCLLDEAFVGTVRAALAHRGLPASLLRLEITESAVTSDPGRALAAVAKIRGDGVQISIDDYGTGFSSLNQLKRLNADEMKIDRTFVKDLATCREDAILVRNAIDLAHALGMSVTAEGVEDRTALRMLHELHCDYVQGFALADPVSPDRLPAETQRATDVARSALAPAQ
jgi:diguanylate cyclase